MFQYEIQVEKPFLYQSLLRRLQYASNRSLFHVNGDQVFRAHKMRNSQTGNPEIVLAWLSPTSDPEFLTLCVDTHQEEQALLLRKIWRHMIGADDPIHSFYDFIRKSDPLIASIVEKLNGYRVLRDATPYESLLSAIISQQLNLSFAASLKKSLLELFEEHIQVEHARIYPFPLPEEVASLEVSLLRERKFSQRKAEYLIQAAQAVTSKQIDFDLLAKQTNQNVIQHLSSFRGIGRWTAECVLMFGMGRPDLLPAADIGLRNAVQLFYGLDHQPREEEIRRYEDRWNPWQSYVSFYLWAALDNARLNEQTKADEIL